MTRVRFENLLEELGKAINIPNLKPDSHNGCLIQLNNGIQIHLEMESGSGRLLFGSDLGAIPQGSYREKLFKAALKANGLPHPRYGILAYSKQSDHLVIYETLPFEELNSKKLTEFFISFSDKAFAWQQALSKGEVPVVTSSSRIGRETGMFGLTP